MSPVALVTGGARGIGRATVDALVATGHQVVVVDLAADLEGLSYSLASAADLAAVAATHGDAVVTVAADVRDRDAMVRAARVAVEHFGGLDVVVAAAGVATGGVAAWEEGASADLNFTVNVGGVRTTAAATIPLLLERPAPRHGRFITVASAAGVMANERLASYTASKHAALGFTRALAADLGTSGVTANAVLPGSTRTSLLDACAAFYGLTSAEEFAVHHLNGRLLEPSEVAATISFLASPAASGVTGAAIAVDGGMTAR